MSIPPEQDGDGGNNIPLVIWVEDADAESDRG